MVFLIIWKYDLDIDDIFFKGLNIILVLEIWRKIGIRLCPKFYYILVSKF